MNSKTLIDTGFGEWFLLKNISHANVPSDQGIVIAIVNKEPENKAESDILYIGRTKKPAKRILGGYLAGFGGKNTKKINQMLFSEGYLEKVAISWVPTAKPRIMQEELLVKFQDDHGKMPAWNANKKLNVKPKKFRPVPKSKESAPPKARISSSASKEIKKPLPKPKLNQTKKPAAKLEASAKTETTKKEENSPKPVDRDKPKTSGIETPPNRKAA
jgi:hypothetical protein